MNRIVALTPADADNGFACCGAVQHAVATGRATAVFGTHDLRLLERVRDQSVTRGAAGRYEVHMLYGIRDDEQRALVAAGVKVRVLISYGSHWFAWYMRRLAERPANVWFVIRSLF